MVHSPQSEFIERSLDNIAKLFPGLALHQAVEEARTHIRAENIATGNLPVAVFLGNFGDVVAIYRKGPYFKLFNGDGTYHYARTTGGETIGKIDIHII